ncbi:MAG: nitroreductase family deazaflavin-dependent oxidoreductase [Thaumarchaeota archaeon]|nr:MAG: nitroreductase family deazaflavin-dependent oxidoreductase [Nitrososphaerota archaeon]
MSGDQFLYISTTGWKTGRQHTIEIWFVKYKERYYVMSEGNKRAHWVQNIIHNSKVSIKVSNKSFAGTGQVIESEEPVAAEVRKLMKAKYGWDEGLIVELAVVN